MPKASEVKPGGPPPQDPYTQLFLPLIVWFYVLTFSEFSCLAKSYPVSGLPPLPHILNQHHFIPKSAHEVLEANWEGKIHASVH